MTVSNPKDGRWGRYGGAYMPETLFEPLEDVLRAWNELNDDEQFWTDFDQLLRDYVGRPSPITRAPRIEEAWDAKGPIYLKREDLNHTGAHKINNSLGQVLLAKRMGKQRIVAETGAGQHGVATATACAKLGLDCVVYMGEVDMARQALNVFRMRLLGAEVRGVDAGSRTLKDAINEAMRDWVADPENTFYCLGSALGPHPYPSMVRKFQSVIGTEARRQYLEKEGVLPSAVMACVGGGSNSIGIFSAFIDDEDVALYGGEAGGEGVKTGKHAARFAGGKPGVLHGTRTYLLQDAGGQIIETHSVSAGLDYPAIGPEHAYLHDEGRATYLPVNDKDAIAAFHECSQLEGIFPALESAHAVALARALVVDEQIEHSQGILINMSGRGDKDVHTVAELEGVEL
jgi:tryptophan synthase beta chain